MRDLVTTALDAAGLVSIALGAGVLAACVVAAVWHDRAAVTLGMLVIVRSRPLVLCSDIVPCWGGKCWA